MQRFIKNIILTSSVDDSCEHRRIYVDRGSVHSLQNESNVNPFSGSDVGSK